MKYKNLPFKGKLPYIYRPNVDAKVLNRGRTLDNGRTLNSKRRELSDYLFK